MLSSACFRDLPLTSSKCPAPCAPGEGVVSVPGCSFSGASRSGNRSSPSPCAQMGTPASLYSQLLARASSCPLSVRMQKSPRTSRWKPGASFSPSPCSPLCGLRHTWLSPHPGSARPAGFFCPLLLHPRPTLLPQSSLRKLNVSEGCVPSLHLFFLVSPLGHLTDARGLGSSLCADNFLSSLSN